MKRHLNLDRVLDYRCRHADINLKAQIAQAFMKRKPKPPRHKRLRVRCEDVSTGDL